MKLQLIKENARKLKAQTLAIYYAARDPRMPFLVRVLAILVAAYALSPIDLIPDFIPIIGLLDDIIIIPAGLALIMCLTPPSVMESARLQAQEVAGKPVSYSAAVIIIIIWLVLLWVFARWVLTALNSSQFVQVHPGPLALIRSLGQRKI
ncbi:DUF1232 domain-containing protein [Neptunicella marina]|uniref:DUF1232 domain-containing protein n=2 Tax=Neptunicella marina TaxID=2125989 RepID=A0A8J6IX49_9ALTE|nr:DUF1232 domain-containing protein [Neptunicella marina]